MLREIKGLHGAVLRAQDGEIGSVDDILFDDELWTARYIVVNTGGWLDSRKVLIAPAALGLLDEDRQGLRVNLTRDQVEGSPSAETEKPVSRQWETDYYDYYGWPYYWGGMGFTGGMGLSGGMALSSVQLSREVGDARSPKQEADERARDHEAVQDLGASHLRSAREVTGYGIAARDGHLGHVADFLIDDETWKIRYLAVDTRDWWPGKKVLLPLDWIGQVLWPDRTVAAEVTRDQVRNGPEWDPSEPISRAFEEQLARYYDSQGLGTPESAARREAAFAGR
jgi:uncharacterized protein YrrD